MMSHPEIMEFDRASVTPMRILRSMSPELRGVVTNLMDALKELRSCVFCSGSDVLQDAEIARISWLAPDVLTRVLPEILKAGFMARDDRGALFSPYLYARLLRKEEQKAGKRGALKQPKPAQALPACRLVWNNGEAS